ncbi:uracil phosphoribosyltransferase-domain-containing protein [Xylaria nigripes]|nr:uracil phosphoribosyltransferase-domain-containing protein [Xylaria nigripes]
MSMFRNAGKSVLTRWHRLLALPRQSPPSWYQDRYREEVAEFHEATTTLQKLSEESDVFFALSRAQYDGFPVAELPHFRPRHVFVYAYMVGKYTSRWAFYRVLAILCGARHHATVREVVNASKDSKLEVVAPRGAVRETDLSMSRSVIGMGSAWRLGTDTHTCSRQNSEKKAPIVVGIYGIPGSGKSYLLGQLAQELGEESFKFYEGSQVIDSIVPGGLNGFRALSRQEKFMWRRIAINTIKEECINSGKVGIVAGHLMFWSEGQDSGDAVDTPDDHKTYTHVLYLEVDAETVAQRCRDDTARTRPQNSVDHLRKWQEAEIARLRDVWCRQKILFCCLPAQGTLTMAVELLRDFQRHTEDYNLCCAETLLDDIFGAGTKPNTMLVFDGDRTLAAEDTGELFWIHASMPRPERRKSPLKDVFSMLGYTHTAFRQAALLYEEVGAELNFDNLCTAVASSVTIHQDFVVLLRLAANQEDVGVLVLTCGLQRVWEAVLEAIGLSGTVKVIGGGRITDGPVISADVKAALVSRLQEVHHMYVWAFGDSPLDLPMLAKADQATVVVGEEDRRSKTMDDALLYEIQHKGLRANQLLLPSNASPRLDVVDLPLININDIKFLQFAFCGLLNIPNGTYPCTRVLHATEKKAAKLLMTPTRDAGVRGPDLQEAHRSIGRYLATELLPEFIGLEKYEIPHVQGHNTTGYRLLGQRNALIVALMRGGEPMAYGIHSVIPDAAFFHGENYDAELEQCLNGRSCVILVDSVVNSGKTIVKFARPIRKRYPTIRIIVVAGVVQDQCLSRGCLVDMLVSDHALSIVALRISNNKFTGKGGTDTGNRLFNTI